jgi:hypothetical protein
VLPAGGAAAECSCSCDANERVGSSFGGRLDEVRQLIGVGLQILEEALKLMLHRIHLFTHVQNDFHTREIYTKITRQGENQLQPRQIGVSVKTRVAFGPRRLQQSLAFVKAQRLRMDTILIRYRADCVCLRFALHKTENRC